MKTETQIASNRSAHERTEQASTVSSSADGYGPALRSARRSNGPEFFAREFEERFRLLRESVTEAASAAMLNAQVMKDAIKESADWEYFDAPGLADSLLSQARTNYDVALTAVDDYGLFHAGLVARAKALRETVGEAMIPEQDFERALEALGIPTGHGHAINMDECVAEMGHLLEMQSWLMDERGFFQASRVARRKLAAVHLYRETLHFVAHWLRDAVATVEFRKLPQRQAA